jgi:tRNA (guanine37-N1)-methyltransferase
MTFSATILTLFPELFPGPLGASIIGRALQQGVWRLDMLNIRDFAKDKHQTVDDTPYGGGAGMVMKPEVLGAAFEQAKLQTPDSKLLYMSPRGKPLTQPAVREFSAQSLIILCGRYEGVDQRVLDYYSVEEVSMGDYVLAGGEIAAMVLIEACVRLVPGVMGESSSAEEESFGSDDNYAGLLEYPHYTKPPLWNGMSVPGVLKSGHHGEISRWRKMQAEAITERQRPDLWKLYNRKMRKGISDEPATED